MTADPPDYNIASCGVVSVDIGPSSARTTYIAGTKPFEALTIRDARHPLGTGERCALYRSGRRL